MTALAREIMGSAKTLNSSMSETVLEAYLKQIRSLRSELDTANGMVDRLQGRVDSLEQ